MAFIRAKQLKLNAAGDIIIGGVAGAGSILPKGALGTVLKATANGLEYNTLAAAEIVYGASDVGAALDLVIGQADDLSSRLDTAEGDIIDLKAADVTFEGRIEDAEAAIDGLGERLDIVEPALGAAEDKIAAIITGVGFDANGEFVALTGDYVGTSTNLSDAVEALDAALAALADSAASDTFNSTGTGVRDLVATTKSAAIDEVMSKAAYVKRDAVVDPTLSNDETMGYAIGDVWVNGSNVFVATSVEEDAAVWTRVDQNANANLFTYKGVVDASQASEALAALEASAEAGDTYKVSVAGDFSGALAFEVNVGDFILFNGTTFDKIDNTDTIVRGTAGEITVVGSTGAGFDLSIANDYVGQASITTLGTITTGTWNGTVVDQEFGGTGIATITTGGDEHKVLVVSDTGILEYLYVSALRSTAGVAVADSSTGKLILATATTSGDTDLTVADKGYVDAEISAAIDAIEAGVSVKTEVDHTVTVGAVNYEFEFLAEPKGEISVYFNGIKLIKTAFTLVSGESITLVDSVLGYSAEAADVISVSYMA